MDCTVFFIVLQYHLNDHLSRNVTLSNILLLQQKRYINVECVSYIGNEQLQYFESTWPEGFHTRLSKYVVIFSSCKTYIPLGEHNVLDQKGIYVSVISLLVSNRKLGPRAPNSHKCESYNVNDLRGKSIVHVPFRGDMYVGTGTRCALRLLLTIFTTWH